MSGPKIIDIAATREQERLRIATICNRMDALSDRADFLQRSNELRQKAKQDVNLRALMDITRAAGQQLEFIRSETGRLRREEIETLSARRSADQAVTALIRELRGRCEDETLREQLDLAENATETGEKLRIYDEVREQMTQIAPAGVPESEVRAWIAQVGSAEIQRAPAPEPVRWRQELQRVQAELELLHADVMAAELATFAGRVEAETNEDRRRLMLDGLRLEVSDHLRALREREHRQTRAAEWRNALYGFPFVDRTEWESRFARVADLTAEEFHAFGEEVDRALDAAIKVGAAELAKQAVLEALLKLGYQLQKGMETALIDEGKVVVKKPGEETYGVEISAPNPNQPGFIKTQVVRTRGQQASTPDALQADKEREEAWCQDSQAMQDSLQARGIETEIKVARPAGSAPVPVVRTSEESSRREEVARPREVAADP